MKEIDILDLKEIIKNSKSFRELQKKTIHNIDRLKKIIEENSIDISHFLFNKDRTGEKFGLLLIKKCYSQLSHGRIRRLCDVVCDCGNIQSKRLYDVTTGRVISCGCHLSNRESMIGKNNPAFKGVESISKSYYNNLIYNAKKRNIKFDLSLKYLYDLYEKQNKQCKLSMLPIVFGRISYPLETTASLDRIDSSKGYIEGNVQWVHKDVNRMKQFFEEDYFINLCGLIYNCNQEKIK